MGFMEGRIVFNSETGIYYSGQTVFGKLIFDQEKNKSFQGIYVKIQGFCYVHWRTRHTRTVNGKHEIYNVDHTSQEDYLNQKNYLIGSKNSEITISQGHYEYHFQFVIPPHCPSSYEGTHGHIRYEVRVVVDRAFRANQEKRAVVRIIAPLDLNSVHGAKDPVDITFNEIYYCCCTRSGSVKALVKLPYGGYIPGQTIPIEVICDNTGSVGIDSITFTLKKEIKFRAQGTRSESEDVAQLQLGEVPAGTSRSLSAEFLIPHVYTPNVLQCRYIDIDHCLQVTLNPDGCHSKNSQFREIIIGTIPLDDSNFPSDQEQNEPIVKQPLASAYPCNTIPCPGTGSYPNIAPYPGTVVTPYPATNSRQQNGNDQPPYAPPYTSIPPGNDFYPIPFSISNTPSEQAPCSRGPTVTPYPTSNLPYPTTDSPCLTSNLPYSTTDSPSLTSSSPCATSNSPYPTTAPYPTQPTPFPPASTSGPYDSYPAPYPTSNSSEKAPYPRRSTLTPYPTTNSPCPTTDSPCGASNSPYPTTAPYPISPSPFPPASANGPYDTYPAPYPTSNTSSEKAPYPGGYTVTPYPTSNTPYPTTNSPYPTTAPYPTSPSPFPPVSSTGPYFSSSMAPTGLRTGTIGFIGLRSDNKPPPPKPPPRKLSYPCNSASGPFVTASAPLPESPSDEQII